MSKDRILTFVIWRLDDKTGSTFRKEGALPIYSVLDDKTGFQTYSSGKKDDFYDICRVEVLAEIRVVD